MILILKICKFCWLSIFYTSTQKVDAIQPLKAMEIWQIALVFDLILICQKSSTNAAEMNWTIYEHLTLHFLGPRNQSTKRFFFISEITPLITI